MKSHCEDDSTGRALAPARDTRLPDMATVPCLQECWDTYVSYIPAVEKLLGRHQQLSVISDMLARMLRFLCTLHYSYGELARWTSEATCYQRRACNNVEILVYATFQQWRSCSEDISSDMLKATCLQERWDSRVSCIPAMEKLLGRHQQRSVISDMLAGMLRFLCALHSSNGEVVRRTSAATWHERHACKNVEILMCTTFQQWGSCLVNISDLWCKGSEILDTCRSPYPTILWYLDPHLCGEVPSDASHLGYVLR